jgi:Fe-S-cluster containining protein
MKRLPLLVERGVREAEVGRSEFILRHDQKLRAQPERVTCEKGCHHCCYYPVLISLLEGLTIYRGLVERRVWSSLLRKQFEKHAEKTLNLMPAVWFLGMIPCPLLHEDKCLGYEARPTTCRAAHSTGDPYYCHPHRLSPGTAFGTQKEIGQQVFEVEDQILKRLDLTYFQMPLSMAVLYAEKITKGELDIHDVGPDLWQKFKENG